LATPNYGYEKRQRELAKKQKKEDKLKAKAARKASGETDGPDDNALPAVEPRPGERMAGESAED